MSDESEEDDEGAPWVPPTLMAAPAVHPNHAVLGTRGDRPTMHYRAWAVEGAGYKGRSQGDEDETPYVPGAPSRVLPQRDREGPRRPPPQAAQCYEPYATSEDADERRFAREQMREQALRLHQEPDDYRRRRFSPSSSLAQRSGAASATSPPPPPSTRPGSRDQPGHHSPARGAGSSFHDANTHSAARIAPFQRHRSPSLLDPTGTNSHHTWPSLQAGARQAPTPRADTEDARAGLGTSRVEPSPSIVLRPISPDGGGGAEGSRDSRASPSPTPGPSGDPEGEAAAAHLRALLQLDADAPISLHSLPDPAPGEKPNYPLPTLIKLAIHGSPTRRLTLQDIYIELENRFQWFRENTQDTAWKNSIRHNLSLRKCFIKTTRSMTEPGKGSYWSLDVTQGEGNKRERKRNKKPTKTQLSATHTNPRTHQHFMSSNFAPLQHPLQQEQYPQGAAVFLAQSLQADPALAAAAHPYQFPPPLMQFAGGAQAPYADFDASGFGLAPQMADATSTDMLGGYGASAPVAPSGFTGASAPATTRPSLVSGTSPDVWAHMPSPPRPPPHTSSDAFQSRSLPYPHTDAELAYDSAHSARRNPVPGHGHDRFSSHSPSSDSDHDTRLAPIGATSNRARAQVTLPPLSHLPTPVSQFGQHPAATALGGGGRSAALPLPPPSFIDNSGVRPGTGVFGASVPPLTGTRKTSGWVTQLENEPVDESEEEEEE